LKQQDFSTPAIADLFKAINCRIPVRGKKETPQDGKMISGHRLEEKTKTKRMNWFKKIGTKWL
jgi:hypothetical protein